ncbi:hypothetical protein SAMN05216207_104918 [Pseudonocardia ammonioxydans]|uniref:Protein phosphatase 2C n=2 Tax=Pseudonocardia ammonioxydans TaxID=260086 RepID=A0A1I5GPA2_PSUAM|nr:hypothetical protein SAMN05216207_104918 [Pseudonocardia ammonioxydans]
MRAITAQLAGGEFNADRVLVADNAVIVLDGATPFVPVDVDPGQYAETLGDGILKRLPYMAIPDAVAAAIESTSQTLRLQPGKSPSSTVSILHVSEQEAHLYALGDSPIRYGAQSDERVLSDSRIDAIGPSLRKLYQSRLRAGYGFDRAHYRILAKLQHEQSRYRNRPSGYWIAEADPKAAYRGLLLTLPSESIHWAVMGTDGAMDPLEAVLSASWPVVALYDEKQLQELLLQAHDWERRSDPGAVMMPRAKPHDDKSLVAVPEVFAEPEQTI